MLFGLLINGESFQIAGSSHHPLQLLLQQRQSANAWRSVSLSSIGEETERPSCRDMEGSIHQTLLTSEKEEVDNLKGRIVDESKKIWKVAFPGILARVSNFGAIVVTQSFIGHISKLDLAGYALVQTLSVRFVNGILIGMSSATETLCGQAYGAGQYHMMGIYLQRSWIVDFIALTIMLPVFIFGTFIFKLLGQKQDIAEAAGYTSLWFIPFVYSYVFSLTIQMFLQAQQKNRIIAWLSILQFVIHVPLSWLFVAKFNWEVAGAISALTISTWISVIGQFVYIFGGWCPDSWKGFTMAALKDIWPVVKLSISSGAMLCLELWYTAVLVLLAGYMKDAEVAIDAFSICLNIHTWEFRMALGFLGAAIVRVANELGRGDAKAVKFSIKVLLCTSTIIGVVCFLLVLVFGNRIGYLFTNEKDVVESVSGLSVLLAFSILLNSVYPVLTGVAIGAGLQSTVAVMTLCCYYLIGIPVGALLGYVAHLQVKIGMSSATETLCGQAYGAGQYHMMGIYLQMSWIIDFITLTMLLPLFIYGTFIFKLLGQKEDIAEAAGYASIWFIPLVYSFVFRFTNQMYLQAQQKNMVVACVSVLQFVIHVPLSWLFVMKLNWGVGGAIAALSVSAWIAVIGQFVYIFGGWCPDSWKGFTMAAFKNIWPVVKLSLSSGVMLCLEIWYSAVLVLLAGYMKDAEVAIDAFSICLNINGWEFMMTLGLLGAATVRVANELGRGDAKATKFSIKILLSTSIVIGVLCFLLVLLLSNRIGYWFSNEKDVVESVSSLSLLLAFSILLNSVYPVLSGVTIGAGLQSTVAIINLCCYYLIGIPVGVLLGYVAHMQVKGIWIGMIFGIFAETLALCFMTWKINWDKEVAKASDRLRQLYLKSPEESK